MARSLYRNPLKIEPLEDTVFLTPILVVAIGLLLPVSTAAKPIGITEENIIVDVGSMFCDVDPEKSPTEKVMMTFLNKITYRQLKISCLLIV